MKHALTLILACCTLVAQQAAPLQFGSLKLFDEHRRTVCAAYMKASSPIYSKGDAATDAERKVFTDAANELVRLQAYVGKARRLALITNSNKSMHELNKAKMDDAYAEMAAAKIKTDLPASRAELNEASKYINALGQIMQLPVSLSASKKSR